MTKSELAKAIAEKNSISIDAANDFLTATTECITNEMISGNVVAITGFGSFGAKQRAARKGINPRTREEIQIPASIAPYFKASANLKKALNEDK